MNDWQAWQLYPHHSWIFNKLELSLKLGYNCGPAGVPVNKTGKYIIRPIYNLEGMGLNARIEHIEKDKVHYIKPGQFWCEVFDGDQISIDYKWNKGKLVAIHASQGYNSNNNLTEFFRWIKIDPPNIKLPKFINEFDDVDHINIEFINDKIIEIHLRHGADFPPGATEIIPVWNDKKEEMKEKYNDWFYKEDFEDCEGHLKNPRLGFYYR
jgi:hypothetical protein|tara:strand:+ start:103 stop:732 length:630 start_codon:yes stop_codon:yes gene_type:complete